MTALQLLVEASGHGHLSAHQEVQLTRRLTPANDHLACGKPLASKEAAQKLRVLVGIDHHQVLVALPHALDEIEKQTGGGALDPPDFASYPLLSLRRRAQFRLPDVGGNCRWYASFKR